jgi:hypothetical protein
MIAASPFDGLIWVFATLAFAVPVMLLIGTVISVEHRLNVFRRIARMDRARADALERLSDHLLVSDLTRLPQLRDVLMKDFEGRPPEGGPRRNPTRPPPKTV